MGPGDPGLTPGQARIGVTPDVMSNDGDMNQNQWVSPRLTTLLGVIPARVAGIHFAAHAAFAKVHGRATTANTRRTEKWAPVTSTGVTPVGGSRPRSFSCPGRADGPDHETVAG